MATYVVVSPTAGSVVADPGHVAVVSQAIPTQARRLSKPGRAGGGRVPSPGAVVGRAVVVVVVVGAVVVVVVVVVVLLGGGGGGAVVGGAFVGGTESAGVVVVVVV
ncbi:MAG TPA: hypothetical protein VN796_00375, partial [Acidimicrobiales bacterium]|nr:hypothetical protein [Acidimicrobiales bacterium]